jgi:hypothetical protein
MCAGLALVSLISRITRLMSTAVVLRVSLHTLMPFLIILCYVCFLNDLIDTIASVRNPSCLFLFFLCSLLPFYWFCLFGSLICSSEPAEVRISLVSALCVIYSWFYRAAEQASINGSCYSCVIIFSRPGLQYDYE